MLRLVGEQSNVVTVLIPSYNPGRYLEDALASVFAQTYPHWTVILVDDASTDDSLAQAAPLLASPKVKLVRHAENLGQSKALNTGLALVETPYVVQLDADDWFVPETLGMLVEAMASQPPTVGVVAGNFRTVVEGPVGGIVRSHVRTGRPFKNRYEYLAAGTTICPRFYRTEALRRIGGWPTDDPYEGRHMEDLLVLYRLIEEHTFAWVDRVLYVHRRHAANNSRQAGPYAEVLEWAVRAALHRWGDRYTPVFERVDGWLTISHLVPRREAAVRRYRRPG